MKRRDFIAFVGGAAVWPLTAHAQQGRGVKHVGVLMPASPEDIRFQPLVGAFLQALGVLGWTIGRNVRIDTRWATGDPIAIRKSVSDLVAAAPDVIFAHGASTVGPLLQATRTIPVVFPVVADPLGAGFVDSLARPGGNATGFMSLEFGIVGKWLGLLKEMAPDVARAGILRDPANPSGPAQFGILQAAAPALNVAVNPLNMRDAEEIERVVGSFARTPNGGLILTPSGLANLHRDLIIAVAARHKLPTVYYERLFVVAGGLISYGPDYVEQYRQAAGYVDRILRGEKPADLPVQAPTKYELTINLKTARALGLAEPSALLARADEIIE
jgi:putative ABC transport system substrate-binding protein